MASMFINLFLLQGTSSPVTLGLEAARDRQNYMITESAGSQFPIVSNVLNFWAYHDTLPVSSNLYQYG